MARDARRMSTILMRALLLSAALATAACNAPAPPPTSAAAPSASTSAEAPSPSTTPTSTTTAAATATTTSARGAVVRGLRAEIVPVIGGLFPSSPVDPSGKPVAVPWVLRVTNTTDAPIVLRTGGDDEAFEIEVRGAGVGSAAVKAPCPEIFAFGKKNVIAAKGSLDVPVERLASGPRCKQTALYLTTPGLYSVDVTLIGHVHESAGAPGKGERGEQVRLEAPTITIKAS